MLWMCLVCVVVLCWIDHAWSSKECVCCACNSNEFQISFHMFCLCFCMCKVISSFRSLRPGSQVFALLMLFLWVSLHTMSSGKSLQLLCTLVCCTCLPCCCCCLPTPVTLASGGSPMFPLVVHQPTSPSIWPAVQSLRRGLSTNPRATMWCVCGCS